MAKKKKAQAKEQPAQDAKGKAPRRQPSLGSELKAIFREGVKDIRNTGHQIFFNQPEHASEPGTPLNPTMQEQTMARGLVQGFDAVIDSYSGRGKGRGQEQVQGREKDKGHEQEP